MLDRQDEIKHLYKETMALADRNYKAKVAKIEREFRVRLLLLLLFVLAWPCLIWLLRSLIEA